MLSAEEDPVHLGGYDVNHRMADVSAQLSQKFAEFRKGHGNIDFSSGSSSVGKNGGDGWFSSINSRSRGGSRIRHSGMDVNMVRISEIMESLQTTTALRVKQFQGPHFTQRFRDLRDECVKYQLELDNVDIETFNREELKAARKSTIISVTMVLDELKSKVHPEGQPCDECEVKKNLS